MMLKPLHSTLEEMFVRVFLHFTYSQAVILHNRSMGGLNTDASRRCKATQDT